MLGTKYPYSILPFFVYLSKDKLSDITLNHFSGPRHWTGFHHDFKISRKMLATVSLIWGTRSFFFWRACSDITITLTFLHSISNHDATQLAANRSSESVHHASTFLGSQNIDTHAPLILYSSLSFISVPFFIVLTSVYRSTSSGHGSSVCTPYPKC